MHRLGRGLLLVVGMFMLTCAPFANQFRSEGSTVIVNGVAVFRLSTSLEGLNASQRAKRLVEKLSSMPLWGEIDIKGDGEERVLSVSGEDVLTITAEEAARHGTTPGALAQAWAAKLKEAIDLPPLKVSDNFVRIAMGASETVKVKGALAESARAEVATPAIATVRRVYGGFQISAASVGHTIVTVESGASQENIDVEVKPYAANFPQTLTAYVTGAPATASMVEGAVEGALHTQLAGVPAAHWSFGPVHAGQLNTAASCSFSVRVWAAGPDAFPASGVVNVVVKNAALPPQTDDALWYSNDPETVRQAGSLFSASLKLGGSARLLYHHLNGTMQDMFFRAEIVNESEKPARIEIIPGDSKPCKDPVVAGERAAAQYLKNWIYGSGEVLVIPPKSAMPLSLRRLSPDETASGLCSLRLIEGPEEVLVRTDAFPPFNVTDSWESALFSSTPWREVGSHEINDFDRAPFEASPHIYPNPYSEVDVSYQVGGRYGNARLGQKPIARFDSDGNLDGNFGVIYSVKVALKNPTAEAADVEIVFEASAGYASGLFVIDGNYVKTKELAPKERTRIVKVHLLPGATRQVQITTLPVSGSSYPATFIVKPVDSTGLDTGVIGKPSRT